MMPITTSSSTSVKPAFLRPRRNEMVLRSFIGYISDSAPLRLHRRPGSRFACAAAAPPMTSAAAFGPLLQDGLVLLPLILIQNLLRLLHCLLENPAALP